MFTKMKQLAVRSHAKLSLKASLLEVLGTIMNRSFHQPLSVRLSFRHGGRLLGQEGGRAANLINRSIDR